MYAVILAGGGGTRLHPLSRPERPKPFLPLLGERSLLQGTVERLEGLTDDITVVTDRRYERLVRDQVPDAALVLEPLGRNTAAAIALATLVIDRPDDEVMVVLPADQTVEDRRLPRGPRARPPRTSPPAPSASRPAGHARHPGRSPGDRLRLPHPRRRPRRRGRWPERLPARPLRGEAEAGPGRGAGQGRGRRLERRDLPVAPPGDRPGTDPLHRPAPVARPDGRHAVEPAAAYEAIQRPVSIDYAVMEGAAQSGQVVMALDGRRLVRSRVVDGAAGGARRARERAPSCRPGRPSRSTTTT